MSVQSDLLVRWAGHVDWDLVEPLIYPGRDETFVVPAGFRTDFASVPDLFTWLVPRVGVWLLIAILHDYLCRLAYGPPVPRRDADGILRRMLREQGISLPLRWMVWAAVRVGSRMTGATQRDWCQLAAVAAFAVPFLAVPAAVLWLWTRAFRLVERALP